MQKGLTSVYFWFGLLMVQVFVANAQIQGCVLPDIFAPAIVCCDKATLYNLENQELKAISTLRFALDGLVIQKDSFVMGNKKYVNVVTNEGTNGWIDKNCLAVRGEGGVMKCEVVPTSVTFDKSHPVTNTAFYVGEPVIRLDRGNEMIYVTNVSRSKKGWVDVSCLLEGETEIQGALLLHDALSAASVCQKAENLKGLREDQRFEYTALASMIHQMYEEQSSKCFTEKSKKEVATTDDTRGFPPATEEPKVKTTPKKEVVKEESLATLSEKPVATKETGTTRSLPTKKPTKTAPKQTSKVEETPKPVKVAPKPVAKVEEKPKPVQGKPSIKPAKSEEATRDLAIKNEKEKEKSPSLPCEQQGNTVVAPTSAPVLAGREAIGKGAKRELENVHQVRAKYTENIKLVQVVEPNNPASLVYTCYHPTLPIGTHIAVNIPENDGFMEFVVVGRLSKHYGLGLNKTAIDRLFGVQPPLAVKIEYYTLEQISKE
ncbi:MAG: hypothetical protein ACKVTZ_09635 [Bacteroidia bacterium]